MTVRCSLTLWFVMECAFLVQSVSAAEKGKPGTLQLPRDISFAYEIEHAIDRGLAFLQTSQDSNGWWSTPDHPAFTALALTAFMGEPSGQYRTNMPTSIAKGYAYILGLVKPDGGIYCTDLIEYNTSISLMALLAANNPAYGDVLRRTRNFLVKAQGDFEKCDIISSPYDSRTGYANKYAHSAMASKLMALEALYYTRNLVSDTNTSATSDINWGAAIKFLQNCQNLPGYNTQTWVSGDATNRGGFADFSDDIKGGAVTNSATGRITLRSCGSISYAGLLSYIYADLKREDPRVAAVLDWLRSNYTLEENPGMGPQGIYYYLHLMTKALNTSGMDMLELKDGTKINWRHEVAMRLINLQKSDGSWRNSDVRWWETDPNLVTAYAVLTLDIIYWGI